MAGAVMAHQSPEGAFQAVVNIPEAFGGTGEDAWAWIACDVPSLLYGLLALGADDPRLQRAVDHLAGLVEEDGWHWEHQKERSGAFCSQHLKDDPRDDHVDDAQEQRHAGCVSHAHVAMDKGNTI